MSSPSVEMSGLISTLRNMDEPVSGEILSGVIGIIGHHLDQLKMMIAMVAMGGEYVMRTLVDSNLDIPADTLERLLEMQEPLKILIAAISQDES